MYGEEADFGRFPRGTYDLFPVREEVMSGRVGTDDFDVGDPWTSVKENPRDKEGTSCRKKK